LQGKLSLRRLRIVVCFAGIVFNRGSEHISRCGHVFLTHPNLKSRAGPRNVFAHSADCVTLGHRRDAGSFERAFGQFRFSAGPVRLHDNKFGVAHGDVLYARPAVRRALFIFRQNPANPLSRFVLPMEFTASGPIFLQSREPQRLPAVMHTEEIDSRVGDGVTMKWFPVAVIFAFPFVLASCGSGTAPTTFTIGGTVSGLNGSGLVLQYNSGNNLTVTSNGTFTFPNAIVSGDMYSVAILTQPSSPAQTCAVTNGASGTASGDVGSVLVVCANNTFTVGGVVSGLTGSGLVLQYNGGSNLPISANGSFSFPTAAPRGSNYTVTVLTQPASPAQTCGVSNGVGTNINGNITAIQVICITTTVTFTVGGTISGLSGSGMVLQNNSGDNLAVSADGSFTFATPIASGSTYSVTVLTQPSTPSQSCVVTGGGGTASGNITGVQVNCTTISFAVGGTITGLTAGGMVLQDNGGDNLAVGASATSFTFATQVASGATYAVTVFTQPTGQTCSVTNGSGTVGNASISSVTINCAANASNVSAIVSGLLPNTSVVLQDNGADDLTVSSNSTAVKFHTSVADGAPYAVSVLRQPAGVTCTAGTQGVGTLTTATITIALSCGNIIAAGESHTCALTSGGAVHCWGANQFGQLGDGSTVSSTSAVAVAGLPGGVVSIAAGGASTCALTGTGDVWCWGDNSAGQLGNGTFTPASVPLEVLNSAGSAPLGGVVGISVGQDHTCAVTGAGAALCWGDNSKGELGSGSSSAFSSLPVTVSGFSSAVATIAAGSGFSCAVTKAEQALCWGDGSFGQLGNGNSAGVATPSLVLNSNGTAPLYDAVAISAGFENACAIENLGTAWCWGANNAGQLGNGSNAPQSNLPVALLEADGLPLSNNVVAIGAGHDEECAVTWLGTALCWGQNAQRQVGNGTTANSSNPAAVAGLSSGAAAIAAGSQHTCAVTIGGAALCWGSNLYGQLGTAGSTSSSVPLDAVGTDGTNSAQSY
jgi:alpha-tubulin suppressor-like RCC1 family protein